MKTRADLLLRDALASTFVRACQSDAGARESLDALWRWSERGSEGCAAQTEAALLELETEHGRSLFTAAGQLSEEFEGLAEYARDRALRMRAALGWLAAVAAPENVVEQARAAWDAGLFFEVHELLEPVWLDTEGERKLSLQGLIMAGAALHHLTRDNLTGARGLLRDAERKLVESPKLDSLDLTSFARGLGELASDIERHEIVRWQDIGELPRF